jgi:UDP-glucose:(heptosyl)LPS alpha-1,3-glucosyltransferase
MRIAVLIRRFIVTAGAERYAVEVTRRLAKGHEVHVFTQQWDHQPEGVALHRVPLVSRKPHAFNQWWFSWRCSRMARGFDVVYSHERVTHFDVMNLHVGTFVGGLWGSTRGGSKSHFRTWVKLLTGPSIWAYLLLEKLHSRPARGRFWIADSEMVKREVQQYYAIPDDRFFIAHSGVDQPGPAAPGKRSEWRARLRIGEGEIVALFVGSEFRRKGLGALVEAMGILNERAPRLVVVGGEDPTAYQARARDLQVGERIFWAGRVSNVQDYYALADLFVLPTLSDASPIAPLEAMAHGCATIISCGRYTGAAELIQNEEALMLQDPRNAREIAQAIERFLEPAVRKKYSDRGRALTERLSWDRTAKVAMEALEKSRAERGARARES